MALLTILTLPDKRLKKQSTPVERVDDGVRRLMDDMLETMYAAPGSGLAAPQVGVNKRVIVVDVSYNKEGQDKKPIFLANPEIIAQEGEFSWEEGCLSIPELYSNVTRHARITVKGLDREGREVVLEAEGSLSGALQHEIDHLDGILYIDHLSRLKRDLIVKKFLKKAKG